MQNKQIEEQELKVLQEFDQEKSEIIFNLGQIKVEIFSLERRINELKEIESSTFDKLEELSKKIQKSSIELEEKYGSGIVNLKTGEITSK